MTTAEHARLRDYRDRKSNWKQWGPYLSERAWGTVREDYSPDGAAWGYLPHDQARSRTYRWNEDGLAGICDRDQFLCFALALWNGRDPILKERLFGLNGNEGNHGEDVKEYYFYADSTPTHSYMRMLYKYPQAAFPYKQLVDENQMRGATEREYELIDTGIFAENRYFDIEVSYAKADEDDILITLTATNRGPDAADLHLLPTLWFRNTWSWGYEKGPRLDAPSKPTLRRTPADGHVAIAAHHPTLGDYILYGKGEPTPLFTENESNNQRIFGSQNASPYVKDAFHHYVVGGAQEAVNPNERGTKCALHYQATIGAGESWTVLLRLNRKDHKAPFQTFARYVDERRREADEFYAAVQNPTLNAEDKAIQRQAFAGLLWSKQLYYYDINHWLVGDPAQPTPPAERKKGRNHEWVHLSNFDVISMPDKWEYPWYAAWDSAFHCIPLAYVDPDFAKRQLQLFTREWYMHPNGQIPAYEWALGDVNPPVQAWAAWRVYEIDRRLNGQADTDFLEGMLHKLLLNFTWWVNRKDANGANIFQGGFLGMDNISLFDRSEMLPEGSQLDQSDGTAWMGFFCLSMLNIALELARTKPIYQDVASKFYEHFLAIAVAMSGEYWESEGLWDEKDGFFYDHLHIGDKTMNLRVRSMVGLIPLLAVETIGNHTLEQLPTFTRRMNWFLANRPHVKGNVAETKTEDYGRSILVSVLTKERLARLLTKMLDEKEFLSPYGIRSLSKHYDKHPYTAEINDKTFTIAYEPAESESKLFGGNSNWRGPVWFPINYLLIEALQRFHRYYGDDIQVEYPTGSGEQMNLGQVARELAARLMNLFRRGADGTRPCDGGTDVFHSNPHWRDYLHFHEYFHGDNGAGLGASHQTGWTALVAQLLQEGAALDEE